MKKNKLIILLTLFLMMPLFVKADMAAPTNSYNIRINNPKGAEIYEYYDESNGYKKTGKKIKYDEIYTVIYEHVYKNEIYIDVVTKEIDADGSTSYSEQKTIKSKDVKPIEVNLKDYKQEDKIKYYVFDDSCYLYNGPSQLYGKVSPETSLSIGTIIEIEYADEMWAYVEQNGEKGWVYTYSYSRENTESAGMVDIYEYEDDEDKIKTLEETVMYKSPKTNEKLGVTIPKETELRIIYSYSIEVKKPYYYVEYNGTKGWIKTIAEDGYLITNIAYKVDYEHDDFIIMDKAGTNFYSEANNKNTVIGKIPYQTKVVPTYYLDGDNGSIWWLIEYNGKTGWIENDGFWGENDELLDDEDIVEEPDEIIDEEENNDNIGKKSINEKIIYYAGGAIILSLTAVVTIILINKKKKEKNANK